MLTTPASTIEIVLALAFALQCFLIGVFWMSDLTLAQRWMLSVVCVLVAGLLASRIWFPTEPFTAGSAIVFAALNVVLGTKACAVVTRNRLRVFGALGASYSIGLLLGPFGIIILVVPSVLLANRKAPDSLPPHSTVPRD